MSGGKLLRLARQLMNLIDRSSMITAFTASVAAMPTPPNLCGVITVNTAVALLALHRCPREIVGPCFAHRYQSGGPALPLSQLTATLSPVRFNSP
jgi:hypothetical protein